MSDTPRTDAGCFDSFEHPLTEQNCECVTADFARTLERELNAAKAEVERLRADAERWRYFVTHCQWFRHHDEDGSYSTMSTRLPYDADQSCVATRNAAIDAAMKEPK
jgi:hypothetical protein